MYSRDRMRYLAAVIATALASAVCSRSDQAADPSAHKLPGDAGLAGRPPKSTSDAWTDQWRKATFANADTARLRAAFAQAAHKELSTPGADPSDVPTKANALARDPQKIFDFIRDSIALEPYVGVLRGSGGTLMAGAGNALDRALLAHDLLKSSNIESRLVAGKLSDTQASTLLSRYLDNSALPTVLADLVKLPDDATLNAEASTLAAQANLPEVQVSELLRHVRAQTKAFWGTTDARTSTQFDFLIKQVQKAAVDRKVGHPEWTTALKSRLREHYWVELKAPNGTWTAFDPSFAASKPGITYGTGQVPLADVPREQYHRLEFSLVYKTVTGGAAKDEVLLTDTVPSADALFVPLEFGIGPAALGANENAFTTSSNQLLDMLKNVKRFRPVLRTGSAVTSGRVFDLEGNTYDPADAAADNSGGTFFGDALGGGEGEAPPQFVELRVVLRFTGPGHAPMSQTRTLVRAEDVLEPSFAPPLLTWDMLLQPQWLSAGFLGFTGLRQTTQAADALTASASAGGADGAATQPLPPARLRLMDLAVLRESAAAAILSQQQGVRALVDQPMLTILGHRLTALGASDGRIGAAMNVDIVANGVRYIPRDDNAQQAAFDAALRQGVADCVLENEYLRELAPHADDRSGAAILEQAQAESRPPVLASARDSASIGASGLPATDVAWIHDNESPASTLVIATTGTGLGTWWSVSADGNAVLRGHGGEGQATTEYSVKHAAAAATLLEVLEFGSTVVCAIELGEAGLEYIHEEGHLSTHAAVNAVVCLLGQGLAAKFAAIHAHDAAWWLLSAELNWHLAQQGMKLGEYFAIYGFTIH